MFTTSKLLQKHSHCCFRLANCSIRFYVLLKSNFAAYSFHNGPNSPAYNLVASKENDAMLSNPNLKI